MTPRAAILLALIASPSLGYAHGLEVFILSATVVGGVISVATGGVSTWRGWHPVKSLVAGVAIFVVVTTAHSLFTGELEAGVILGSLALAPMVGLLPVGAGYMVGRWLIPHRVRRNLKPVNGGGL